MLLCVCVCVCYSSFRPSYHACVTSYQHALFYRKFFASLEYFKRRADDKQLAI
jgi:hypothetical protein